MGEKTLAIKDQGEIYIRLEYLEGFFNVFLNIAGERIDDKDIQNLEALASVASVKLEEIQKILNGGVKFVELEGTEVLSIT